MGGAVARFVVVVVVEVMVEAMAEEKVMVAINSWVAGTLVVR